MHFILSLRNLQPDINCRFAFHVGYLNKPIINLEMKSDQNNNNMENDSYLGKGSFGNFPKHSFQDIKMFLCNKTTKM